MMRSMFSAVSGLKAHQTKMDVIGNNIANVNTVAFKSQSVTFSDVYYQTTQTATGPNTETGAGGTNPMQIGTGSSVASISTAITTQGAPERTDFLLACSSGFPLHVLPARSVLQSLLSALRFLLKP